MRPPSPEPVTDRRSIPLSRAIFFASGLALRRSLLLMSMLWLAIGATEGVEGSTALLEEATETSGFSVEVAGGCESLSMSPVTS